MNRRKQLFRALRLGGAGLLLLLAVSIAVLMTPFGGWATAKLAETLLTNARQAVIIEGLSGPLRGAVRADRIAVRSPANEDLIVLQNVELDWSPLELLGARLTIHQLSASDITVNGLPEQGTDEGGGFSLPLEIALAKLSLPSVTVGQRGAGEPMRLAITGAANIMQRERNTLVLSVDPVDTADAGIAIDASFDPRTEAIDATFEMEDTSDRRFAELFHLADAGRIGVSGTVSGTLQSPVLALSGRLDDRSVLAFNVEDSPRADGFIQVSGEGAFSPFLPDFAVPFFAGSTRLAAELRRDVSTGAITLRSATLDTDTVTLSADGTVHLQGNNDFRATIALPRMISLPLAGGVGVQPATLSFVMSGPSTAAKVDVDFEGAGFSSRNFEGRDLAVTLRADRFNLEERGGAISLTGSAAELGAADPRLAILFAGGIEASATVSLADGGWSLDEALTLETGTARATVDGSGALDFRDVRASVETTFRTAILDGAPESALEERLNRFATLTARMQRTGEDIALTAIQFDAGPVQLSDGTFQISGSEISGDIAVAIADLSRLSVGVAGKVAGRMRVSGTTDAPELAVDLQSETLGAIAAEQTLNDLAFGLRAIRSDRGFDIDLDLSGDIRAPNGSAAPLEGTAKVALVDGAPSVEALQVVVADNRVEGRMFNGAATDGITLKLPDIGALGALFGQAVEGQATGRIFPKGGTLSDGFTLDLTIDRLAHTAFGLSGGTLSTGITPRSRTDMISGTFRANSVNVSGRALNGLSLDFAQANAAAPIAFDLASRLDGLPLSADGTVVIADGTTALTLASASALIGVERVSLAAPARVTLNAQGTFLDAPAIAAAGGRIGVSGRLAPTLDVDASLTRVPLDLVRLVQPGAQYSGSVSGTVAASGELPNVTARFELNASSISVPQTRDAGLPPLAARASGTFANQRLQLNATLGGVDGFDLRVAGTVDMDAGPALALNVTGPLPLSLVRERLMASGLSLTGNASIDLSVRGVAGAPAITGAVNLTGGRLISVAGALDLRDLNASLGLQGDVLTVNRLTGEITSGGTVSGSGTIGIAAASGFPADLALRVAGGRYTDGRMVTAQFDADLAITGPLASDPLIGGTVNLSSVVVSVPDTLPKAISTLDIQRRNASDAVLAQDRRLSRGSSGNASAGVRLGVTVTAPSSITVRGRGIDARLGGQLRLEGRSTAPRAIGSFSMDRGTIDLIGRTLRFTSGTLTFTGSLTPVANFVASAQVQSTTVSVRATGPVNALEFSFSSVPDLPEDEVLALLIFGRSLSNLSPVQIVQLAQSIGQLTGVTSGPGLVDRLTRAAGLDSIDVETDEETGSTAVRVGKALNERTRVSFEKDAAGTRAVIDLDIGRGVRLRGQTGTDGEAKGGLFFEREY